MPSKRTNDSVDRILEELNMQQAQAGLRDSVTDHQVDEILRSVGILSLPDEPLPEDKLAFPEGDALDDLLQKPVSQPAPAPAQPRPYTPVQQPDPQPVQPDARTTRPPEQPLPTAAAAENTTGSLGYDGDTTRTGIIKDFLLKMAPDGSAADTDALNQGKNQFQKFFKNSVAVVPDEKGRMPKPEKKKRGFLGLKHAEDTGAFVPINVSLSGKNAEYEDDPAMQQEYYPDQEPEQPPQRSAEPRRKQGFLGGLFAPEEETEELMIPEERAEEPSPYRPGAAVPPQQPVQTPSAAAVPVQSEPPVPPAQEETSTQEVWRSKYTRPARRAAEESGHTVEIIQGTVGYAKNHPSAPSPSGMTGTIYRKKKNTVEFTPGQKIQKAPPPQPVPQRSGEPVGEPIETPRGQTSTGYTMQIGGLDAVPVDSTQDFMAAYNAVRPQRRPAPAPVQPAAPVQTPPAADAYDESAAVDESSWAKHDGTGQWPVPRQWDDVDTLVNTLTGNIHLTPTAPEHSGYTQNSASGTAPSAPAHSGFTQRIDMPAVPAPGSPANAGSQAPAPAHTGFTQRLDPAPAQPAHSGYTQNLNQQASAAPDTASFVNGIAAAINTQQPAGDTRDYDSAAARLTDSLADDPAATRTRARIPTAAEVKKAAARLTGRADDEIEDNAASPFDTAEIPVPHSREYERAEDAPAIRALLAKKRARAGIACIVSGAMSLVMIVLALLPVRPAALNDPMVYPAALLVLLLVSCAVNWRTFLDGFRGLGKTPSPDSLSILPALGAAVQCLAVLATGGYTDGTLMLAGPAALMLCMNAAGHALNAATVCDAFESVSGQDGYAVAYRLKDAGALRAISQGLSEPHPCVLVTRPTQIFRSFLTNSAAHGTSDKNQQQFVWLLGGCGLAAFLFTLITSKSAATAATAMTSLFCLAAPLAGTLMSAVPARMMQQRAYKVGAVIPGWRDIRQLGRINVVQATSRQLFPEGCVTLRDIHPVKMEHIDTAIIYAASMLADTDSTLNKLFTGMVASKSLLEKVTDRQAVPGKGYMGWIRKERVILGNRAMMMDYGIKVPSQEYEQHYTLNQRRIVYMAVAGKLYAMFRIAYQSDPKIAADLELVHRTGMYLVVDCDDFNCDVRLLETAYGLPTGSVKVLSGAEHEAVAPAVAWLPESEGSMLHLGSFRSLVGGLVAAAGAAQGEKYASYALTLSVLASTAVGVLMTLTGGIVTLPLIGIVLYQAAWLVITLFFPLMQR